MRETLVISHVTLVMSSLVVKLGPVSVTVVGVVLKPYVQEVCIAFITCLNVWKILHSIVISILSGISLV